MKAEGCFIDCSDGEVVIGGKCQKEEYCDMCYDQEAGIYREVSDNKYKYCVFPILIIFYKINTTIVLCVITVKLKYKKKWLISVYGIKLFFKIKTMTQLCES